MANKKLKVGCGELKLPAKGEKKPKWQAKTGKGKSKEVEIDEPAEMAIETPATELEQPEEASTSADMPDTD